ncbi:MAG: metallophosphoesterase [candidate division Zixibacteria bacterium]
MRILKTFILRNSRCNGGRNCSISPLIIIVLIFMLFPQTIGLCQESNSEYYHDGPYIFWETDTSATVFYLCDEELKKESIPVSETLRFVGFCSDTSSDYVIAADSPQIQPDIFDDVSKIMAISDIHGEYDLFEDILIKGGAIDNELNWIWGDGHLVIVGDVFDRGAMVTECLWLIYRLESEARKFGGAVHYILGNHEMMVLRGDNRYVHEKYLEGIVKKSRIKHEDLYSPDMELGRWLRSKHLVVIINDIVFVHGGLSRFVIDRGLTTQQINDKIRIVIDQSSARLAFDDFSRFLLGSKGPLWYRGYHYEMEGKYSMETSEDIDKILVYFNADAIVVGHTEADSLMAHFNNRIFSIDIPMDELGSLEALFWENGVFYRIDYRGNKKRLK